MADPSPATADRPEVQPVRPGEDLPWDRLEAYLREHVEGVDGAVPRRAVPERRRPT